MKGKGEVTVPSSYLQLLCAGMESVDEILTLEYKEERPEEMRCLQGGHCESGPGIWPRRLHRPSRGMRSSSCTLKAIFTLIAREGRK